jgi:hypothetical protein
MYLKNFIGQHQLAVMLQACHGEEGEFFRKLMEDLEARIAAMPKTYETDGSPGKDLATLHYFKGGSDWWIIEKDAGSPDDEVEGIQAQAFGLACLNGDVENAELGYISIAELIKHGVELDLYYKPESIGTIKARLERKG